MALARCAVRAVALVSAVLAAAVSHAQGGAQAEIDFLITRVEQSGCAFVRNGAAHPAQEAAAHLRKKLNATRRGLTAEQFIEHVAARSSISGEPYFIRCANLSDEPSAVWLRRALKERTG